MKRARIEMHRNEFLSAIISYGRWKVSVITRRRKSIVIKRAKRSRYRTQIPRLREL